jgi:hypothetical protein
MLTISTLRQRLFIARSGKGMSSLYWLSICLFEPRVSQSGHANFAHKYLDGCGHCAKLSGSSLE